jgi:hypothetical protein
VVVGFRWDLEYENYPWAAQTSEAHAVLTPHGVKATLVPFYVSSSGIPAVQKGRRRRDHPQPRAPVLQSSRHQPRDQGRRGDGARREEVSADHGTTGNEASSSLLTDTSFVRTTAERAARSPMRWLPGVTRIAAAPSK